MKICAVICEYNPFHNGHRYLFERIREDTDCDKILCLMSGNFTQRGEAAVFDKFTRARHAVECGADAVAELPAAFAVSPAELFAGGAVHILSALPAVTKLAFGCESGDRESFLAAARAALSEDKAFKAALKERMKDGVSYIRARNEALLAMNADVDEALLSSPNNILGTEYCRAILASGSAIEPFPVPRKGSGYADTELHASFSSATALRAALADPSRKTRRALKGNLPETVYRDALAYRPSDFEKVALCALVLAEPERIAACPDCSEGLENRLKTLAKSNPDYTSLLKKSVSKRYTLSRLKRILAQNLLGVRLKETRAFLAAPLYLKLLAVRAEGAEELLASLREGTIPVLARKSDALLLKKEAADCFALDARANELYAALTGRPSNEYQTLFL